MSRHFFMLSDQVRDLRRELDQLRAEVVELKERDKVGEESDSGKNGELEVKMVTMLKQPMSKLVDSWMLGIDATGIFRSVDKRNPPIFKTNLPFHYAWPGLSNEVAVEGPVRMAVFKTLGLAESERTKAVFARLFYARKGTNKDDSTDLRVEGFCQRYMRLRRQVKNDKIGKPVLDFIKATKMETIDKPWSWRQEGEESCGFFKNKASRKLFKDVFKTSLDGVPEERLVLSVIQLAMLANTIYTKILGNKVSPIAPAPGDIMAATATGSDGRTSTIAGHIAHGMLEVAKPKKGSGDEPLIQPCDCCWVVDVNPRVGPREENTEVEGGLLDRQHDGVQNNDNEGDKVVDSPDKADKDCSDDDAGKRGDNGDDKEQGHDPEKGDENDGIDEMREERAEEQKDDERSGEAEAGKRVDRRKRKAQGDESDKSSDSGSDSGTGEDDDELDKGSDEDQDSESGSEGEEESSDEKGARAKSKKQSVSVSEEEEDSSQEEGADRAGKSGAQAKAKQQSKQKRQYLTNASPTPSPAKRRTGRKR